MKRWLHALVICVLINLLATTMSYVSQGYADSESPDSLISRNKIAIDTDVLLLAADVQKRLNSKNHDDTMLVDARSSESFQKVRIPGSINIPLFALKTKTFLKAKQLVLVNEGYGYNKLVQECRKLRKKGFKSAHILKGGLNAWQKAGGHLEGDVFEQKEVNKIPPQSFFEDKNYRNIIVVNVYGSEEPEEDVPIPGTINIQLSEDVPGFVKDVKKKIAAHKDRVLLYVVIVSEDDQVYKRIEKDLENQITESVFYLKGGIKGYREFLKHQSLILQPKKVVKTRKDCPTCE